MTEVEPVDFVVGRDDCDLGPDGHDVGLMTVCSDHI